MYKSRQCSPEWVRAYRKRNPDKVKAWRVKGRYGVPIDEIKRLEIEQDGKCAVCRQDRKLVIDHDHETGAVRGLLCYRCNADVGAVDQGPEHVARLIAYTQRGRQVV